MPSHEQANLSIVKVFNYAHKLFSQIIGLNEEKRKIAIMKING